MIFSFSGDFSAIVQIRPEELVSSLLNGRANEMEASLEKLVASQMSNSQNNNTLLPSPENVGSLSGIPQQALLIASLVEQGVLPASNVLQQILNYLLCPMICY